MRTLRTRARFQSESWATMIHPTLNCRPPLGSQKCDTVDKFSACDIIASRIRSTRLTDSSERERDSEANLCSPQVNCRPPWGSQNCDTVDGFSVCERLTSRLGYTCLGGQLRTGARFWSESLLPRSELQTPIGEPEVQYCRRIHCLRADCKPNSLPCLDGQLRARARFWDDFLVPRSELQTPIGEPEV